MTGVGDGLHARPEPGTSTASQLARPLDVPAGPCDRPTAQSHAIQAERPLNELRQLQDWYLAQCDRDWEHGHGVAITTLDNPGWSVTIHLEGTVLESRPFATVEENYAHDTDWLRCWLEDGRFEAAGGPLQLTQMLRIFLDWAAAAASAGVSLPRLSLTGGAAEAAPLGGNEMPRYELRYFFDPGSGICLWSANDEAREKFGYPIELDSLGLTETLRRRALHLIRWFDTSIDWSSPGEPSPWSREERARFAKAAVDLLSELRKTLGHEFEIRDEVGLDL
jgi:hypothetical protein